MEKDAWDYIIEIQENSIGFSDAEKLFIKDVFESENASDILNVLNIEIVKMPIKEMHQTNSQEEKLILELLSKNPIHIDEITRQTNLQSNTVAGILSIMEIKGWTKQIGGMYYIAI